MLRGSVEPHYVLSSVVGVVEIRRLRLLVELYLHTVSKGKIHSLREAYALRRSPAHKRQRPVVAVIWHSHQYFLWRYLGHCVV